MPEHMPDPTRSDQRPTELQREDSGATADERGPLQPAARTVSSPRPEVFTVKPDPGVPTGGMVAGSGTDLYRRDREADLWGAAGADDIHEGLGDAAELSPDEAARVLFGQDASVIRSAAREGRESGAGSRRLKGETPLD